MLSNAATDTDDEYGLIKPQEVADMFHVDPKTVARWANAGKLRITRTLGGHRRYHRAEVEALRRELTS